MLRIREIFYFYSFPFGSDDVSSVHFANDGIHFVPVTKPLVKVKKNPGDQIAILARTQLFPLAIDTSLLTEDNRFKYEELLLVHKETNNLYLALFDDPSRLPELFATWKQNLLHLVLNGDIEQTDLDDFAASLENFALHIYPDSANDWYATRKRQLGSINRRLHERINVIVLDAA